jgi:hypothetical protein
VSTPKTNADHIAEITKRAAEIAAAVPQHLQEAAFNRAFDALSESGEVQGATRNRQSSTGGRREKHARVSTTSQADGGTSDPTSVLISSLSRTDHPEIMGAARSLDRALHLLRVAHRDYGIDGLTASQIAKVLTDKFRHGALNPPHLELNIAECCDEGLSTMAFGARADIESSRRATVLA